MLTKTVDEWPEIFDSVGAPASSVHFAEELADDPQVEAMGYMLDLDHELTGPERMVGPDRPDVEDADGHGPGLPTPRSSHRGGPA